MAKLDRAQHKPIDYRRGDVTRRRFLGTAAATGVLLVTPGQARRWAAHEQLQIAVVGLGGRGSDFVVEKGWSSVSEQIGGRVAALCDVNQRKAAKSFELHPYVPKYDVHVRPW